MREIKLPLENLQEFKVAASQSAMEQGSGTLAVLASPSLIAMMENTAYKALDNYTEEGETSVGTRIDLHHLKASAIGETIKIRASLISVDQRKLVFEVEAYSQECLIARAHHERFLVDQERFMDKITK